MKGKVLIGNGGAEFGVRGYVTAYDAETGKQVWRFYTVPGDPAQRLREPSAWRWPRQTWNGEWWKLGGGGTVWDAIAYDPELDLLYIGTGNGSAVEPDASAARAAATTCSSPRSSRCGPTPASTSGTTRRRPGETWDYTATQQIILADLTIDGKPRKVLMQAPKNGFFYVLDRETGELISAKPYAPVNWASGIDLKTGRPIENPEARYDDRQAVPQHAGCRRGAQLAADGLQPEDRPGLHPRAGA